MTPIAIGITEPYFFVFLVKNLSVLNIVIQHKRQNMKKYCYLLLMLMSFSYLSKAQMDTLHYEDFSDSTLTNWTRVDSSNKGHNWIWTKVYPVGYWRPTTSSLISNSSNNGFICLPADFYNTPWNPPISGIDSMDAWISSKAIPITPSAQVEIQFSQFLSYCCTQRGLNSGIQLQVSNDSLNWNLYDVTSTNARSGQTANSELQIHDVSSVLAGEDTAYIRFRFSKASWYFWMVDDLVIKGSTLTSVDKLQIKQAIALYPNPTNGLVHIQGEYDFKEIEVRDPNGKLVYKFIPDNQSTINLSFLPNGLYFLHFKGQEERVKKLVIQK